MEKGDFDELKRTLLRLAVVLGAAIAALLLFGCRTVTATDRSAMDVERRDSVRTEAVAETERTEAARSEERTETERTETEERTTYTFGDGGGTYNERTGEWSGLASVTTNRTEQALRTANARLEEALAAERTRTETLRDSVAALRDKSVTDTERTETASAWWAWLLVGFVVGFVTPIALKRLPYVGVLFKWL